MPLLYYILLGVGGLLPFSSLRTPCTAASANGDTLVVGEAVATGDKLISRNGKFALGFFQFEPSSDILNKSQSTYNTTTTAPGWYLGIWFNKIPVFTVVWVANREKPIIDHDLKLAQFKISRDGNLAIILNNASTESVIRSTNITVKNRTKNGINSINAILSDIGNFALSAGSPSSHVLLWQSFDYLTDVLLPGAKFGRNKVTGFYHQPIAKKSLIDPGLGSYEIHLDINGAVVLRRRNYPSVVYWSWSSGESSPYKLIAVFKSYLDMDPRSRGLINPAYFENNGEEHYMYTSSNESTPTFALLDITGQLKMMVWSQDTQSWQSLYGAQPADPCTPYATCGPFTVCNGIAYPFCDCMESFSQKSPRDWELGDRSGGCVRNTPLDCTSKNNTTSSTDVFHPIAHVALPYDPKTIVGATTESLCAAACLDDFSCTAYSYNNSICTIWHGELLHVNENDDINNTSEDVIYIRLAAKDMQSFRKINKRKPKVRVIVTTATASILTLAVLLLLLLLIVWRNKFKWCGVPLHHNQGSGGIKTFRYTDLSRATKNFSQMLGGGGFGLYTREC